MASKPKDTIHNIIKTTPDFLIPAFHSKLLSFIKRAVRDLALILNGVIVSEEINRITTSSNIKYGFPEEMIERTINGAVKVTYSRM